MGGNGCHGGRKWARKSKFTHQPNIHSGFTAIFPKTLEQRKFKKDGERPAPQCHVETQNNPALQKQ